MRKHWSKRVEADLEAEYMLPLREIVSGYFADGESLDSTAAILEVRRADLVSFCGRSGLAAPRARRRSLVVRAASSTRADSVRAARWDRDPISFSRLSRILGINHQALKKRVYRCGGDLLRAVVR